jgi:hypothetical protein
LAQATPSTDRSLSPSRARRPARALIHPAKGNTNMTTNTAQAIIATGFSAGFDIANLTAAVEAPVTFDVDVLFNDDGDPIASLIIVGKNSEQYQKESHALRAEGHQRAAKRKTAIDAKTEAGAVQLVDLIDVNQERLALAVVVGWKGFTSAGVPVPFDKALVKQAFAKFPTWVEAVSAALAVDANFLKLSSPTSSPSPVASSSV